MMKKVLFMALTILLTLSLVGCGGGDTPAEKPAQEKKDVTADKAIVTYAELLMTGESGAGRDRQLGQGERFAAGLFPLHAGRGHRSQPFRGSLHDAAGADGRRLQRPERYGERDHPPRQRGGYRPPGAARQYQRAGHVHEGGPAEGKRRAHRVPAAHLLL